MAGVECERCPGASDSEHLFRDIQNGARKLGNPTGRVDPVERPSSSPALLSCIETVQKVLEDAIVLFFLEPPLEKDRGVRWINSVKVLLSFFLSFLFSSFFIFTFAPSTSVESSRIADSIGFTWLTTRKRWFGNTCGEGRFDWRSREGRGGRKGIVGALRERNAIFGERKGTNLRGGMACWKNLPAAFRSLGLLVTEALSRRLTRIFMSLQLDQLGSTGETMRPGEMKETEREMVKCPRIINLRSAQFPQFSGKIVKEKTEA